MGRQAASQKKRSGAERRGFRALIQKERIVMIRKWTAGALSTLLCLFGLTASAAAASGTTGPNRHVDPKSVVTGLDAPEYDGRKPGDHPKLDRQLNDRADFGGANTSRVVIVLQPGCSVDADLKKLGAKSGRSFGIIS